MDVEAVVDTNVLVYSVSHLGEDREKQGRAEEKILQKFYVNVTRKIEKPSPTQLTFEWLEQLERQPRVPVDATPVKNKIVTAGRYRISCWNSAILAAAEALGAEPLYTEDLNPGQLYGPVRVISPFHPA